METPICTIKGCTNTSEARGWCRKHYGRWYRHGDPNSPDGRKNRPKGMCSLDGCRAEHYGKGLCKRHYTASRRSPTVVVQRACSHCSELFDVAATNKRRTYCSRECKVKAWNANGGQWLSHKKWWLMDRYGITIEEYTTMRAAQGGGCAICGKATPDATDRVSMHSDDYWLHVDHDHDTGKVRGLLCGRCNQVLGKMEDNPLLLRAAASYLG